jgi:hypothetical protein
MESHFSLFLNYFFTFIFNFLGEWDFFSPVLEKQKHNTENCRASPLSIWDTLYLDYTWTQNLGLLPIITISNLTQFHPSESATWQSEYNTSCALEGIT